MSDWEGMEDSWLDSYWEERLSGPYPDEDYPDIDRLEDLDDDE